MLKFIKEEIGEYSTKPTEMKNEGENENMQN
jgi:hypothetical protein